MIWFRRLAVLGRLCLITIKPRTRLYGIDL